MNIAVVGSCADSNNLAKELNKRLNDSIIARVDLLKNIKELLLQDMNVNTNENLGTYVGDVESYDFSKISTAQRADILKAAETINKNVVELKKGYSRSPYKLSTFDALTNSLPTGTYSFIKVYSGIIDDSRIEALIRDESFLTSTIFVKFTSPKDVILPINVSQKHIDTIKKDGFAYVECADLQEIFKSEVFQLLFETGNEKTSVKTEVKEEVVMEQPAIRPGQGLIHHLNVVAEAA